MSASLTDEALRSAFRDASAGARAASPRVPLEEIAALVERRGSEAERLRTLDAVMRDPASRREFELLRAISVATPVASRRIPRAFTALAAAAVLAIVALPLAWQRGRTGSDALRDGEQATRLIAPPEQAGLAEARRFAWHAYPQARRYRFELLTVGGEALFTTRTADTVLTIPDDVRLTSGSEYRWWVSSELADGTQRRSPFRRLVIRAAP